MKSEVYVFTFFVKTGRFRNFSRHQLSFLRRSWISRCFSNFL